MMQTHDPIRALVNIKNGATENLVIQSVAAEITTGNNSSVIAAVSGKVHRIMGWSITSLSGASTYQLKNGSGGTVRYISALPTGNQTDFKPIVPYGYFECSTNTALVIDIATTAVRVNVFYVTYTP